MRFLFAMFEGGGNLSLILPIVAELVRRGHEIRVLAGPNVRAGRRPTSQGFLASPQVPGGAGRRAVQRADRIPLSAGRTPAARARATRAWPDTASVAIRAIRPDHAGADALERVVRHSARPASGERPLRRRAGRAIQRRDVAIAVAGG